MFQGVLELSSPGDPNVQNLYPAWDFNQFLAVTIRQEVKVILLYIVLAMLHNRKKYVHILPIMPSLCLRDIVVVHIFSFSKV